jgi:hypothetical protein
MKVAGFDEDHDEDKKAWNIALSASATAAALALGAPDQPLAKDKLAALRALSTDELRSVTARLMQDARKRYGVRHVTNPLTFVGALNIDGVRGLKRVDKGRTSDEQIAIIERMVKEVGGQVPERTFFQRLLGRPR